MADRKINEAKNYIKSAPDLSGGYVDLAIAYAQTEKYPQAIKALGKTLELAKTANEKYIVYYNLAVININVQKPEKALEYALKAKEYDNAQEINELILEIKKQIK